MSQNDDDSRRTRNADDLERHERLEAVNRSLERHNRELIEQRARREESRSEDAADSLVRLGALVKSDLDGATTLDSLVAAIQTVHGQEPSYSFLAFAVYMLGREQLEAGAEGEPPTELAEIYARFADGED